MLLIGTLPTEAPVRLRFTRESGTNGPKDHMARTKNRRRCEGILVERNYAHLAYWKRCTAMAFHGDYCTACFQRRKQNDSARKCLVPGWETIIEGDESRRGQGRVRISLGRQEDIRAAEEIKKRERAEAIALEAEAIALDVVVHDRPPSASGPTEPVLLNRKESVEPDDIFATARKALDELTKI